MAELTYDAVTAMGVARSADASLLPATQRLELFVTLTDYHGYQQPVHIHDPPMIHERDHRHVLRFCYRRGAHGDVDSDFDPADAPALAFAARATSSFPGAFPPARIAEIDALLERRRTAWTKRDDFIAVHFPRHVEAGVDPASASFIDGAVLNNRPFREAIAAIRGRAAYRQVDRRLVYIKPDPAISVAAAASDVPGFFATLKGAISDIPRNQPVTDDLGWVTEFNDRVRRRKALIEAVRPHVSSLVGSIVSTDLAGPITAEQIRTRREQVGNRVALDAGFAYHSYMRVKLGHARDFIARRIARLCGWAPQSVPAQAVAQIIDAWALEADHGAAGADPAVPRKSTPAEQVTGWARFLLAFDIAYRRRRLHFLIEGLNRTHETIDQRGSGTLDPQLINRLKRALYGHLETLSGLESPQSFDPQTVRLVAQTFVETPSDRDVKDLSGYARRFVRCHQAELDRVVDRAASEIDLTLHTRELDATLAAMDGCRWPARLRRDVLVNYLGFPFWDVLTLSVAAAEEMEEFHEILVERISPADSVSLEGFDGAHCLKGVQFGDFAAFLSRAYREHDYLLGRLHAIDRLIDIVCDSGRLDPAHDGIDIPALKRQAFLQVLEVEEKHLSRCAGLICALRACIAAIRPARADDAA